MLEAVVPISGREAARRHLDRLSLLIRSFGLFWRGEQPLRLHVVVPDDEYVLISVFLERFKAFPSLDINLLSETQVSPALTNAPHRTSIGVMKQMLIKLAAFNFVKADYCLMLDSDIVACRPFSAREMIVNGRILTEWRQQVQIGWWRKSARMLGYELTADSFSRPRIFVTPQILARPILEGLHAFLEARHGASWMTPLIDAYTGLHPNIWTEYALYDLFAAAHGIRETYHLGPDEMPNGSLHCLKQSLWQTQSYAEWEPGRALEGKDPGYFLVLQSILCSSIEFEDMRARWQAELRTRHPAYIG